MKCGPDDCPQRSASVCVAAWPRLDGDDGVDSKDIARSSSSVESRRWSYHFGTERPKVPPLLIRRSPILTKAYYINHHWKSVTAKTLVVMYMAYIWWLIFRDCSPWYEFFFYLTLQAWTIELVYFSYSLYLDLLSRWSGGPEDISSLSKAAAQALSELCFALQVVVVLFFWIVVYPQEQWRNPWWELNCHGVGLLLAILDYLYRFTGFSLRNHRFVIGFAAFYSVLHISVVLRRGEPIYPGITFRSAFSFVIFLAGLSTLVITHKIVYLITNWRFIKEDLKTALGISYILLLRQDSFDMSLAARLGDFGTELLSLTPRLEHGGSLRHPPDFKSREEAVQATDDVASQSTTHTEMKKTA